MSFRLVEKEGEPAVLHRDPAREECNLDDTDRDRLVSVEELDELDVDTRRCRHCFRDG